ncbi:MAG: SDR family NAD(P)-dependent oxidoreductase [Clostridiales bacterium]|nr:SDR family NAD(P)-dependent oxidoreductase [Clostridiales bacterium]
MDRLKGHVIVVTGATKGIGKSIAYGIASEGADVVIGGRSVSDGELCAEDIRKKTGREVCFVPGDIAEESSCESLVSKAVSKFGKLSGLVNNAGVFPPVDFLGLFRRLAKRQLL